MLKTLLALLGLICLIAWVCLIAWALPAHCENCPSSVDCYNDFICGENCRCLQPNGPGSAGFCG